MLYSCIHMATLSVKGLKDESKYVYFVILSRVDFDIIRQNFYTACNLNNLFHIIYYKLIFSFIHAVGLISKL